MIARSTHKTVQGHGKRLNEDSCVVRDGIRFWGIADGKMADAFLAAALESFEYKVSSPDTREIEVDLNVLLEVAADGNKAAFRERARLDSQIAAFATVMVLSITDSAVLVVFAGDCRLYRSRAGEVQLLNTEQTWEQEQLRAGMFLAEIAAHPLATMVSNAVATEPTCDFDQLQIPVLPGDRYLLCTDGFWRWQTEEKINAALTLDQRESCVSALLTGTTQNRDDSSVLVIDISEQ